MMWREVIAGTMAGAAAALLLWLAKKGTVNKTETTMNNSASSGTAGSAPVRPVEGGYISSPYGHRGSGYHYGTDVAVPVGTAVRSPWSGTIKDIYVHNEGGLTLHVRHDNGWTTGFCHLQSTVATVGQRVAAGDVVARSGGDPNNQPNSGHSTGPHLHVSLRNVTGTIVDPQSVLPL